MLRDQAMIFVWPYTSAGEASQKSITSSTKMCKSGDLVAISFYDRLVLSASMRSVSPAFCVIGLGSHNSYHPYLYCTLAVNLFSRRCLEYSRFKIRSPYNRPWFGRFRMIVPSFVFSRGCPMDRRCDKPSDFITIYSE